MITYICKRESDDKMIQFSKHNFPIHGYVTTLWQSMGNTEKLFQEWACHSSKTKKECCSLMTVRGENIDS